MSDNYLQATPVGHTIENAFEITDRDKGRNAELSVSCLVDSENEQVNITPIDTQAVHLSAVCIIAYHC